MLYRRDRYAIGSDGGRSVGIYDPVYVSIDDRLILEVVKVLDPENLRLDLKEYEEHKLTAVILKKVMLK